MLLNLRICGKVQADGQRICRGGPQVPAETLEREAVRHVERARDASVNDVVTTLNGAGNGLGPVVEAVADAHAGHEPEDLLVRDPWSDADT